MADGQVDRDRGFGFWAAMVMAAIILIFGLPVVWHLTARILLI
jgi:hypothetical protein